MTKRWILYSVLTIVLAIGVVVVMEKRNGNTNVTMKNDIEESSNNQVTGKTLDWIEKVEKIFNRKGTIQENVFKITFPRSDLKVKVDEIPVQPGLALTSWIALKPVDSHVVLMGDLVLLEKEVDPVVTKLETSGLEVTALHNHLIGESPKVMYLHISGHGEPVQLAGKVKDAIALTNTPLTSSAPGQTQSTAELQKMESILGYQGKQAGDVIQFSIPRKEPITETGIDIPPVMGTAHSINFQVSPEKKAAVAGDLVLVGNEVNPVIQSLRAHGISVTAVHNHMLTESPRLFFLHFWAYDNPEKLAHGMKEALNKTNSK